MLAVEINGEEAASIVEQKGIDAGDERAAASVRSHAIRAAKMAFDHVWRHGDELLVRTVPALHLRLAADAAHPFVGTRRRMARSASFGVVSTHWKDIGPSAKETTEEGDLICARGAVRDGRCYRTLRSGSWWCRGSGPLNCLKLIDPMHEFQAFLLDLREPLAE